MFYRSTIPCMNSGGTLSYAVFGKIWVKMFQHCRTQSDCSPGAVLFVTFSDSAVLSVLSADGNQRRKRNLLPLLLQTC